jgi:hypothetical protein
MINFLRRTYSLASKKSDPQQYIWGSRGDINTKTLVTFVHDFQIKRVADGQEKSLRFVAAALADNDFHLSSSNTKFNAADGPSFSHAQSHSIASITDRHSSAAVTLLPVACWARGRAVAVYYPVCPLDCNRYGNASRSHVT